MVAIPRVGGPLAIILHVTIAAAVLAAGPAFARLNDFDNDGVPTRATTVPPFTTRIRLTLISTASATSVI